MVHLSHTLVLLFPCLLSHTRSVLAQATACNALASSFAFPDATIINITHIDTPNTVLSTPGVCQSTALSGPVPFCRVQLFVNTSTSSSVHMEAWLPDVDNWFGRILGLGNGGLAGCIDYNNLPYGTSMHFATVSSDNGHDGPTGVAFLNHPEVILDFAFRSIHVENQVIKSLVNAYYGRPQDKTYYLGCSTGGRQGFKNAEMFPDDFDGFVVGAPAVDWNHLLDWSAFISIFASTDNNQSLFGTNGWNAIAQAIADQCDGLDGKIDGIITEPDECVFRPEVLACPSNNASSSGTCLTESEIEAVRKIYAPIVDDDQTLLFPRFDPGAEAGGQWQAIMGGPIFTFTQDWFQHVVFNDSSHNLRGDFSLTDVHTLDAQDPGGISTFSGNLSAFLARGGKLLSYHGRKDQLIASGSSKRHYNRISSVMGMSNLDHLLRTFLIPGMFHCSGGPGAWAFGQGGITSNLINDTDHNILLALVDWVENGNAPETMTGVVPTANGAAVNGTRVHCRWPIEISVLGSDGETFECVPNPGGV